MADCNSCKTNKPDSVSYVVHESTMARMERQTKRLWITILVLIFLLVGTNCACCGMSRSLKLLKKAQLLKHSKTAQVQTL